jgi:hypothetical protein
VSYSVGQYENGKHDGITLQFTCDDTGDDYYVIFNVDLVRKRTTKNHKKGSPLPKGHFTPRPKSGFVKMWRSTSLPLPKSLTSFHDCMGKLKSIVFKAQTSKNNRLDAGTLRPMDLSDNYLITTRQLPDKNLIITPDKEISQTLTNSLQGEIPTTCENKYVISKQVSEYTSTFTNPSTTYTDESSRVANQTIEEWHADYDAVWSAQCEDLF